MMPNLILITVLLTVFSTVRSLECPSTCPIVTTSSGISNCCSIGDGAAGCGVCEFSTCSENNFASCVEAYGTICNLDSTSCEVKSVGGTIFCSNAVKLILYICCTHSIIYRCFSWTATLRCRRRRYGTFCSLMCFHPLYFRIVSFFRRLPFCGLNNNM